MVTRLLITSALLLGGAAYLSHVTHAESVALRQPLSTVPLAIEQWRGRDEPPLSRVVLDELGVDEYVMRTYAALGQPFVGLYVGFYESQRQGDTIHSPLNCLPGAGWQPVRQDRASIAVRGADGNARLITVNEFVVQKALERVLVLYWYQSHGRIVASEYVSRMYMVADAIRLNRTDASLVRVITPIEGEQETDEQRARARARQFVHDIFPALWTVIPS